MIHWGDILWSLEEWLHDAIKRYKANGTVKKNACKLANGKKSFSLRKIIDKDRTTGDGKDYYQKLRKEEERFVSKYVDKQ